MKRNLRIVSLVFALISVSAWVFLGANRGWTRTSVATRTVDEVTGIEGIQYQKRFVPGVDLLGGALMVAGLMACASLFLTHQPKNTNNSMNKKAIASLIGLLSVSSALLASPQTFDFKDPKGVNNAIFKLDAPLEAIQGSANGISGAVTFDPETGALTEGKLVITTETLYVPNPMMKQHLHGNQWMDVAKYPEITFATKSLNNVKVAGENTTAEAVGTLTIKGVSKEIKVPVKLTYLRDKLGQRVPNMKGDLLVLRSHFTIKRSDFGINPGARTENVSDEIELALSIAGAAAR